MIGIDAGGKERTYYPSTPLKPSWMVHDVPLLASDAADQRSSASVTSGAASPTGAVSTPIAR